MLYYLVKPLSLPSVRFAHFFAKKDYEISFRHPRKEIELSYLENGTTERTIGGCTFQMPQESFSISCRTIPNDLKAEKGVVHMHYTCDILLDYECELTSDPVSALENHGDAMILPVFLEPCSITSELKLKLMQTIFDYNANKNSSTVCALSILGMLSDISRYCINNLSEKEDPALSLLCYKVKKIISANVDKNLTLSEVAREVEKSPNYVNSIFKKHMGMTIMQYASKEKIGTIIELKKTRGLSFEDACACVGITDVSYGYRLFKKHMGVTPKKYFDTLLEV